MGEYFCQYTFACDTSDNCNNVDAYSHCDSQKNCADSSAKTTFSPTGPVPTGTVPTGTAKTPPSGIKNNTEAIKGKSV